MAQQTFTERMTPLDLLMPRTYISALLAFSTSCELSEVSKDIQASLANVSTQIPWLRGKVFPVTPTQGEKPGLEIRWTADDAAPQLVNKGSIKASYEELAANGFQPASIPHEVWPVPGMIDEATFQAGAPVLAASLFQFGDSKGIGLCLSVHHNAVDGAGFAEIVRLLAQSTANQGASSTVTSSSEIARNARLRVALTSELGAASAKSLDDLFALHSAYSRAPPALPVEFPKSTSSVLSIPMSRINHFKYALKKTSDQFFSENTVVCALVWSAITRARLQRDPALKNENIKLMTAVNGRNRLSAEFSPAEAPYLGNVVMYARCEPSVQDAVAISDDILASMLSICNAISHSQSPETINATSIAEAYTLANNVDNYQMIFPGWDLFGSRDLCITSWARLHIYEDFGGKLGRPEFVRIPYAEADGVALILPKKNISGPAETEDTIDVNIMLRHDDMEILKQNGL